MFSVSFDFLEPFARSGIMIFTSSAFDSSVLSLELFTMPPARTQYPLTPRVALCVLQVCFLVALTIFIVLVRLLEFGRTSAYYLVAPPPTPQVLVAGFPSNTAVSSTPATSIGSATIPLATMPSVIKTILAASYSYSHGLPSAGSLSGVVRGFCSSCVTCGTPGTSGKFSLTDSTAPTLTCPQFSLAIFFASVHSELLFVTDASELAYGSLRPTLSPRSFICGRPSSLT